MNAAAAAVLLAMTHVDGLVALERGKDAREIAALDRRADAEYKPLAAFGWRAAEPLGAAAKAPARVPKARLFAAVFLGRLGDPAAFAPLSEVLLDDDQDAEVRVAAAQGLSALDAPAAPTRAVFCGLLPRPELPRPVLDETLIALSRLGCDDGAALEKAARAYGPRPSGPDEAAARRALAALGRSRGAASLRALLATVAYFPPGGAARAQAVAALDARRGDIPGPLAAEALPVVREALRTESGSPEPMVALVRIADALGPEADALLTPLAAHADAEVLTDAAEALARRKVLKALPVLEAAAAGALTDPRFAPKPGRPDPALLLARLEDAVAALRRSRSAAP